MVFAINIPTGTTAYFTMRTAWRIFIRFPVKPGDKVQAGDILGTVQETALIEHKIMVPPDISGIIESIAPKGTYKIKVLLRIIFTLYPITLGYA